MLSKTKYETTPPPETTMASFLPHSSFEFFCVVSVLSPHVYERGKRKRTLYHHIVFYYDSTIMSTVTPSHQKEKPSSPRRSKLYKCGHCNCPGLGIPSDKECSLCGVCLHSFCVAEACREIADADPAAIEDGSSLCSVSCYHFKKIEGLTADMVKAERAQLLQKNKEALKKEARDKNVKVNFRVNGASRDAPKEVIVARLLKKKNLELYPSLAATQQQVEDERATNKITANDKFRLINVIFQESLPKLH